MKTKKRSANVTLKLGLYKGPSLKFWDCLHVEIRFQKCLCGNSDCTGGTLFKLRIFTSTLDCIWMLVASVYYQDSHQNILWFKPKQKNKSLWKNGSAILLLLLPTKFLPQTSEISVQTTSNLFICFYGIVTRG